MEVNINNFTINRFQQSCYIPKKSVVFNGNYNSETIVHFKSWDELFKPFEVHYAELSERINTKLSETIIANIYHKSGGFTNYADDFKRRYGVSYEEVLCYAGQRAKTSSMQEHNAVNDKLQNSDIPTEKDVDDILEKFSQGFNVNTYNHNKQKIARILNLNEDDLTKLFAKDKKIYRQLSLKFHPDKTSNKICHKQFIILNIIYNK